MPSPDLSTLPERQSEPDLFRWTRRQYDDLVATGFIEEGARVELLDGYIVHMPVQSPRHYQALRRTASILRSVFATCGCDVREQAPLALDEYTEPEPDIAVVAGAPENYAHTHPTGARLVVEVSESTLAKDRGTKLRAYARNLILEYWILNLPDWQLEVYRQPEGEVYRIKEVLRPGQAVSPLANLQAHVKVTDLLP